MVRYLDVSRPTSPFPLPSPLRILVVIASPRGLAGLDLRRERTNIESAWGRNKNVEVVFLQEATLGALREELLEAPIHVLHFMGHGGFDDRSGEGVLYFVGPDGGRQPISGHVLASKLKDFKTLRLVFLNACNTAKTAGKAGVNPFAGVASALVLSGIPAVVAMQLPISDRAAIAFSRSFYQRLSAGEPVDTAVAEGRQAVHSEDSATTEWATPVLFLRTPDGALFNRSAGPVAAPRVGVATPAATARPGLLGGAASTAGSSLLGGGTPPRKGSGRKLLVGAVALAVAVSIVGTVIKLSLHSSSSQPQDTSVSALTNSDTPSGAPTPSLPKATPAKSTTSVLQEQAPMTVKRAEPVPTLVLEINQDFRTSIQDFIGRVSKVEIRGDRMRWYFQFFNKADKDYELGFNYKDTYIANESGERYGVIEGEDTFDINESDRWTVQQGVRLDRWIDFPAPKPGEKTFTVRLVSHNIYYSYAPQFPTLTVSLPPTLFMVAPGWASWGLMSFRGRGECTAVSDENKENPTTYTSVAPSEAFAER